jgi:uncharacterized protein (DUF2267 family)
MWNGFCRASFCRRIRPPSGRASASVEGRAVSQTGFSEFDAAIQKTNVWLKDLMALMRWEDRHRAYFALRTVLHALRDHLPVESVVALGAQLPMLVRGFYYDGWRPAGKPLKDRRRDAFLQHLTDQFGDRNVDSEEAVRAVLRVLNKHLSEGEIAGVRHCLPAELRLLWPTNGY